MHCPNCGSKNVQYSQSNSGGGYGMCEGCCGFMMLGPLGLLCGTKTTSTEKFWICSDCGSKISHDKAKEIINGEQAIIEIQQTYKQYEKELEESPAYYIFQYNQAKAEAEKAEKEYDDMFRLLIDKYADANHVIGKYKKKYSKEVPLGCFFSMAIIGFGILGCIAETPEVGIPIIIFGCFIGLIISLLKVKREETAANILFQLEPSFKDYQDRKEEMKKKVDYWEPFAKKAEYMQQNKDYIKDNNEE